MYQEFFGLREQPFALTPNTHFYLNAESHRQALELLLVALKNQEGFIKISGEVGTGKTLVCRKLLNSLDDPFVTAYLPNPQMTPENLYLAVADELGIDIEDGPTAHQVQKRLTQRLVELASIGKRCVLIIDEAQVMPEETIEALRLLTNIETESSKLLQIVLFGQPELDALLSRPSLRQLQQRITFQQYLAPLDREGVSQYIYHRVTQAGYNGPPLFEKNAISLLSRASKGIPRLINILAHKALVSAYGQGQRTVNKKHVRRAVQDTESVRMPITGWLSFCWPMALALVDFAAQWIQTGVVL